MLNLLNNKYYPPVGFYFRVDIADPASVALSVLTDVDNAFQEVSGLSVEYDTESVAEGGENRFAHKLPVRTKYPNLVLKRGLVTSVSAFSAWGFKTMADNLSCAVTTRHISVMLLNAQGTPSMAWMFVNAWPVKVHVSDLQSMENKIAVETMEFAYQYSQNVPVPPVPTL